MLQQQNADFNFGAFKKEMLGEIEKLEDALMNVELKLQESLFIATNGFQERVKNIIGDMRTKLQNYIKEVNEIMELFSQDLKVYALAEYDRINSMEEDLSGGDAEQLSDDMIHLMSDSDALIQHLEGSKENVDAKINDVESQVTKELLRDWKNTENRILDHQHHRNRTIVQEVIRTCEKFRKEISKQCFSCLNTHYL
jgi:hypothetical protein